MSLRDLGRTLRSPAFRGRVLMAGWVLALGGLLFRAGEVQLREGAVWRAEAERQHQAQGALPAARGGILDRDGRPLAMSHEVFRVGIAPHELLDRDAAETLLVEALGLAPADARRAVTSDRRWVQLPQRYPPRAREALARARGIYVERELSRSYPHGELGRGILGVVIDDAGTGGIEQAYEEHLRGMPGSQIVARDAEGRPIPGESWMIQAPRSGGDIVLTLDRDLQEIAQEALLEAITETGARGGDLLVTDPRTGEILAMVSILDGSSNHLGGVNTPYEPGSTLKPFTVAGLLELGLASMADSVDTENGWWTVGRRTIRDVSRVGKVSLSHALRVSSNVGIAKVAGAYTPLQQFEVLRDFGFGVPTGLPLPGEASGTLRHPRHWSGQSAVSLSMGYEIAVTPLQMAMAYGALANGGLLMEPRLVREVRAPDGRVLEKQAPRVVRRTISAATSDEVNRALVEAVQDGTGTRASLGTFQVAGKSGTARATGLDGRYEVGAYFASFVGFFPAENPQLVVFVKLDRPQGAYYGGVTAAPVTRATMEAVLAARHPPLDRQALASIARRQEHELRSRLEMEALEQELVEAGATATGGAETGFDAMDGPVSPAAPAPRPAVGVPALFASWEARSGAAALEPRIPASPGSDVKVPEVRGLQARTVIRRLHGLGLHVSWEGQGEVAGTLPRAGARVHPGDTIRVLGVRPGPPAGSIPGATPGAAASTGAVGAPVVSGTSRLQAGASRVAGGQRR